MWRGSIVESETPFTVPEDGLYHIAYDSEIGIVTVARVVWGIIGGATPGGWAESTEMEASAFDLNTISFSIPSLPLFEDDYKFRYSNGWKVILDADYELEYDKGIKVNANFGGEVGNLIAGGANLTNNYYANYTITITWSIESGHTASVEFESEANPLSEYPESMYLVGEATAYGWDQPGTYEDAIMHKCAGGSETEGLFWKILHIEAGLGFKLSAEYWENPNIGFFEVDEFDPDGIEVINNDINFSIEESGMYMVVLDLRNEMTKVSIKPATIYGIGDAFGGWDEDMHPFTVDNATKTIVSPEIVADAYVRMYADHAWIPAWWNAEFNVFNGVIEYRNDGGDQELVAATAGQIVTLSFDDNTGVIE